MRHKSGFGQAYCRYLLKRILPKVTSHFSKFYSTTPTNLAHTSTAMWPGPVVRPLSLPVRAALPGAVPGWLGDLSTLMLLVTRRQAGGTTTRREWVGFHFAGREGARLTKIDWRWRWRQHGGAPALSGGGTLTGSVTPWFLKRIEFYEVIYLNK
jgi:hypothetical protein